MPTSKRFCSTSSRCSASSRPRVPFRCAARSSRTFHAASRTCWMARASALFSRCSACARFEPAPRLVRLFRALADRIRHADADRPRRVVAAESADRARCRTPITLPGSDDACRGSRRCAAPRCRRGRSPVARIQPHVRQFLVAREPQRALAFSMSLRARTRSVAVAQRIGDRGLDVDRRRCRPAASRSVRARTFQTSRRAASKISRRSRSSDCFTAVSATMSCSWFAATSACADTRSMRRRLPDVHLGLVHAHQFLGEQRVRPGAPRRWRERTPDSSRRSSRRRSCAPRSPAAACRRCRG